MEKQKEESVLKLEKRIEYLEGLLAKNKIEFEFVDLEKAQIYQTPQNSLKTSLSEADFQIPKQLIERYSRQMILPQLGYEAQIKLIKAKVLIVGVGGIGCPALQYLVGAGIGTIGLVDHDVVDTSNLHRQIVHKEEYVGIPKTSSGKIFAYSLNPNINIIEHNVKLDQKNAIQIIQDYDIVLDASDTPYTRYLVNDASIICKKTLISASAVGWEGQLTIYGYQDGPCYRCLFPESPKGNNVQSCSDNGVIGMLPGMMGVLQALEVIKVVTGVGKPINKELLIVEGMNGIFKKATIRGRQDDCHVCGKEPKIKDITTYDYNAFCNFDPCATNMWKIFKTIQILNNIPLTVADQPTDKFIHISWQDFIAKECIKDPQHKFLDVRPSTQYNVYYVKNFESLPLSQLRQKTDDELKQIVGDFEQKLFVTCRKGNASKQACRILTEKGYKNVYNCDGGLDTYAVSFDQNMPFI